MTAATQTTGLPVPRPSVNEKLPELIALRRDLHQHAELSTEEHRTQALILERLRALGLEGIREIADTGATGLVRGAMPGPNLLWRADIDGLPLDEQTGLPFSSENKGAMHACGHDGHTAIALAMATLLQQRRDSLAGTIRFAFQPAEERVGGARRMIDAGVMDGPKVDRVFGLHIMAGYPTGEVRVGAGAIFAAATHFRIIIRGHGGHASAPHQTVDPVVVAAHTIVALQTIVSRAVDPEETAVLSIGRLEAGKRGNIIPEEAMMSGSIRTFKPGVLKRVLDRMQTILAGVCAAWDATCQFDHSTLPACVNESESAATVERAASSLLGADHVSPARNTGADDMAYFLEAAPGAFFFLGGGSASKTYPHHHPKFDFDEDCLGIGIELGLRIIEDATGSRTQP